MSDFIRQMVGQRRGVMGQMPQAASMEDYYSKDGGRPPSPQQRQMPLGGPLPMGVMDDLRRDMMQQGQQGSPEQMRSLKDYYSRERGLANPPMDMSQEALRNPNHPLHRRLQPAFW